MQVIGPMFILIVFGFIIFQFIKGIKQWNYNNKQPILAVWAKVVSKRTQVSHRHHGNPNDNIHHSSSSTTYFTTFEVESGDRLEFSISGKEYGQLVEGDVGKLSFQGTRYLQFERQ